MGFSMTPSTEAITSSLPADQQGVASALNDITRELGTALGVALLGPLVTAGYSAAIGDKLNGLPQELITTAKEGLAHAQAVAPGTGTKAGMVIRVARESFVSGWQQAMWIGAGIMAVLFIYILIKGPQKNREGSDYGAATSIANEPVPVTFKSINEKNSSIAKPLKQMP